jgi:hypothetical protein
MKQSLLALAAALMMLASTAKADTPPPMKLTLSPAKPPSPALRYQLLPDARLTITGDAAPLYKQVIDLLEKVRFRDANLLVDSWQHMPLNRLPKEDVHKLLDDYNEIFEVLDKAARCDHCDWGLRERWRKTGILTSLPEIDYMRACGRLLALRARLAIADERFDLALTALRTGFALARNTSEMESLLCFLFSVAIAADMERQLDTFVSQPAAPNLYYALTDLPVLLVSIRKSMQGERLAVDSMFPELATAAADPQAGNIAPEKLEECIKTLNSVTSSKPNALDRIQLGRSILAKHETAKKALIADGRPREKVEAMSQLQVALLHAFLEYDTAFDEQEVALALPYWEQREPLARVAKRVRVNRTNTPEAPAIELALVMVPHVQRATLAAVQSERRIALLRCIEAIRFYAATHDGKLPPTLADIKEVPIPRDPMTGKAFEYDLDRDTAILTGPAPAKDSPSEANYITYELRIKK